MAAIDWGPLVEGLAPARDELAGWIPEDQHAVLFPSFGAFVEVLDESERHGTPVLDLFEPRSEDAGTRELELIEDPERLQVVGDGVTEIALAPAWPFERSAEDADAHPASPLPGRVVELRVKAGDAVARGDVLAVVEGMKMQHAIRAGRAGRVAQVLARPGELVEAEAVLFDIDPV